jgi:hypothetical protein
MTRAFLLTMTYMDAGDSARTQGFGGPGSRGREILLSQL